MMPWTLCWSKKTLKGAQRKALKGLIEEENELKLLQSTVSRHQAVGDAAERMLAELCPPDIPHMDMRVVEKLLRTLASEKLNLCISSKKNDKQALAVARVVEATMRTHVLGTEANPSRWTFPWKKSSKGEKERHMDDAGLSGRDARKCMKGLKRMAKLTHAENLDQEAKDAAHAQTIRQDNCNFQQKWIDALDAHDSTMTLVTKRSDFTPDQMDEAHIKSSSFMAKWVGLAGGEHVTNCIHVMGAGHICCCLKRFKNLWRFSQQGWEATNQKWKKLHFHNTNHGGNCGRRSGNASGDHLCPPMRMNLHNVMWHLGCGAEFFRSLEGQKKDKKNNRSGDNGVTPVAQMPQVVQQQADAPASEPTMDKLQLQATREDDNSNTGNDNDTEINKMT